MELQMDEVIEYCRSRYVQEGGTIPSSVDPQYQGTY